MKHTIVITESMADAIKDALTMTHFKFNSNIKKFLADLLEDPVNCEPNVIFKHNGIDKNKLLKGLEARKVIIKKMNIDDHDSDGKPHKAMMIVKYSVPKDRFQEKLDTVFDDFFPDFPTKINEMRIGEEPDPMRDPLRIAKASPLTMGFISQAGNPRYGMGKFLDDACEIYNKKIEDRNDKKKVDEEGGAGGATSCGSVGGVDGGTEPFNMPLFGVQKKKKYSQAINEGVTGIDDDNRGAAGYIYCQNPDGQWCILAGKRITNDDSNNLMNPPMGHLHVNEDPQDGVARECHEETGLMIPKNRFIQKEEQEYAKGHFTYHFVAVLYGETTEQYEPGKGDGENEQFKWIPVSEIGKYKWAFGTQKKAMKYIPSATKQQNPELQNDPNQQQQPQDAAQQPQQAVAESVNEDGGGATSTCSSGLPGEFDVPFGGDKETLDRTPGNVCGMHNRV